MCVESDIVSCQCSSWLSSAQNVDYTLHSIYSKLAPAREHLRNDPWAGIPELVRLSDRHITSSLLTIANRPMKTALTAMTLVEPRHGHQVPF